MAHGRKALFLDVDDTMYDRLLPNGERTAYNAHAVAATEAFAVRTTGRPAEELREYRKVNSPIAGHDQALLDFLGQHTGKVHGIDELAVYRNDLEAGFKPEQYLERNERLITCLEKAVAGGYLLVAVSNNPIVTRIVRQLGVTSELIPEDLIYDPIRMGAFKNAENLKSILSAIGVDPADAAMFGDSERGDLIPAREAGMKAFLCEGVDALVVEIEKYIA